MLFAIDDNVTQDSSSPIANIKLRETWK